VKRLFCTVPCSSILANFAAGVDSLAKDQFAQISFMALQYLKQWLFIHSRSTKEFSHTMPSTVNKQEANDLLAQQQRALPTPAREGGSPQTSTDTLTLSVDPGEVAQLLARWPSARRAQVVLEVDDPFLTGENQLLAANGRRAEICYVLHCGDPAEGVLLHSKTFYPEGVYRLPTGGIHTGEPVVETLQREIYEETGLIVGEETGQVRLERFLGVLAYALHHRTLGNVSFATYHFLVCMSPESVLVPQDPAESIRGWQWRPSHQLADAAATLDQVGLQWAAWGDWGRFRALSHRFVQAMLLGIQGDAGEKEFSQIDDVLGAGQPAPVHHRL